MDAERLWLAALGQLQIEMPRAAFDTWVRDAEFLAFEDGEMVVGVGNSFARDWLQDRLQATVNQVLSGIAARTVQVRFIVSPGAGAADQLPAAAPSIPPAAEAALGGELSASQFNPRYSFESFVVGASNRLAHAAALAVAENPASAYNPLFLYGGVGLGKTHLLHAVGHATTAAGLRALYVSSEDFTNELIDSIRRHTTEGFRQRYRRIDVLLIDDIQFLAGKESTQEEFFHTFNALHGQNKQLVISSDRPPKAFVTLEERLRSRFEWGLTADIQSPDFETRLAILRSKAERAGFALPQEYLELIAARCQSNIRELEGALTRVLALSGLTGQPLGRELIQSALAEHLYRTPALTPERIIAAVANQFQVDEDQLLGPRRSRQVALPRQVAMYLLREETNASLPAIGDALGGRDHTTVLYGYEKIADLIETDDLLRKQVSAIRQTLHS
jgi:chromosomal replication initiator protein